MHVDGDLHHECGYHSKAGAAKRGEKKAGGFPHPRERTIRILSALPLPL